jgi:hypothetical protein
MPLLFSLYSNQSSLRLPNKASLHSPSIARFSCLVIQLFTPFVLFTPLAHVFNGFYMIYFCLSQYIFTFLFE